MVDEKPRTRQLDAIQSEHLRAKPLKRRRFRLKRCDNQLEKTTKEILSTLTTAGERRQVVGAPSRKPLPAIAPASDWLADDVTPRRRHSDRKRDVMTIFDDPVAVGVAADDDASVFTRRNSDVMRKDLSDELDWLNDHVVTTTTTTRNSEKKKSRRNRISGETIAESELSDKLALDDTRPPPLGRRTSRHQLESLDEVCGAECRKSSDSSSEMSTIINRPHQHHHRRRRGVSDDVTTSSVSDSTVSDSLSSSYDPSMMSGVAAAAASTKTVGQRLRGHDVTSSLFPSSKRHKKRQRTRHCGSLFDDDLNAAWPDLVPCEKNAGNPAREQRKPSYHKLLPPLTESMQKSDSYL